jgi:hypothetical protein
MQVYRARKIFVIGDATIGEKAGKESRKIDKNKIIGDLDFHII